MKKVIIGLGIEIITLALFFYGLRPPSVSGQEAVKNYAGYYFVASSDAPSNIKDVANYVVEGTAWDEIQSAIDRAAADGGGTVKLSAGKFDLGATPPIVFNPHSYLYLRNNVNLLGSGFGTVIYSSDTTPPPSDVLLFTTYNPDKTYGVENVKIADMKIIGRQRNHHLLSGTFKNARFENLWLLGGEEQLQYPNQTGRLFYCEGNIASRILFENSGAAGYELQRLANNNILTDSEFINCGTDEGIALHIEDGLGDLYQVPFGNIISNIIFKSTLPHSRIYLRGARDTSISNVMMHGMDEFTISTTPAGGSIVRDAIINNIQHIGANLQKGGAGILILAKNPRDIDRVIISNIIVTTDNKDAYALYTQSAGENYVKVSNLTYFGTLRGVHRD